MTSADLEVVVGQIEEAGSVLATAGLRFRRLSWARVGLWAVGVGAAAGLGLDIRVSWMPWAWLPWASLGLANAAAGLFVLCGRLRRRSDREMCTARVDLAGLLAERDELDAILGRVGPMHGVDLRYWT
ncbi:MAG TPA: hypothetical protein VK486_06290 [Thermoleophilaceae bacterium]|nr:hypothetical protein [Thermoleophilaceae bacterium]